MRKIILFLTAFFVFQQYSNSQERLKSEGRIPVLAWYGIPFSETTVARYQEMKDAGITHQLSFFPNIDEMQKALDIAEKVGIQLVVSCPELKSDPEKTAKRFLNHPAVAGYHLMDEPTWINSRNCPIGPKEYSPWIINFFAMSTCFRM